MNKKITAPHVFMGVLLLFIIAILCASLIFPSFSYFKAVFDRMGINTAKIELIFDRLDFDSDVSITVNGTTTTVSEQLATLGYDKDGVHYTYLDRVGWLCRCGLAPHISELQAEVDILANAIDKDGICRATVDENQLKGISTYGGQQLEVDWKTDTRKNVQVIRLL